MMQKIIVIGSGGAGKSTFSRTLGTALDIPVIHLDKYYWQPGWKETEKETWRQIVSDLVKKDRWIMDGNYSGTFDIRFPVADTIFFLNYNRFTCLYRIYKRRLQYRNKPRPDLTEGCPEKVDWDFIKWVWTYPYKIGRPLSRRLQELPARTYEFKTSGEAERFIRELRSNTSIKNHPPSFDSRSG